MKHLFIISFLLIFLVSTLMVFPAFATTYISENFENFTTGWTTGTGGSGTIGKSAEQYHGGSYSGKFVVAEVNSYAYALQAISAFAGTWHLGFWFYVDSSITPDAIGLGIQIDGVSGTKTNLQTMIAYSSGFILRNGKDSSGTNLETVCSVTANSWHSVNVYYDNTANTLHYYYDGVKQGTSWTIPNNTTKTRILLGDWYGATYFSGHLYIDDLIIDNTIEPTAIAYKVDLSESQTLGINVVPKLQFHLTDTFSTTTALNMALQTAFHLTSSFSSASLMNQVLQICFHIDFSFSTVNSFDLSPVLQINVGLDLGILSQWNQVLQWNTRVDLGQNFIMDLADRISWNMNVGLSFVPHFNFSVDSIQRFINPTGTFGGFYLVVGFLFLVMGVIFAVAYDYHKK